MTLGAATQASAGVMLYCPRQGSCVSGESDRDSVARWLANLTTAAKRLHGQPAALPSAAEHRPAFDLALLTITPPPGDHVPTQIASIASHLIDLPPPSL